jgi:putative transcriptional regulator
MTFPSRTGQILVASRRLLDPNFVRTVVLIVQQDDSGVIGLILNRPLDVTVAEACDPSAEEAAEVAEKLYQGGPCPGPLMVLHSDAVVGGTEVMPGVRFTSEREQIQCLMRGEHAGPVRYYAGYSGWSPQQLEDEIEEGAWLLSPASSEIVFNEEPANQWSALTTRLTVGKWVDVDRMPEDPTSN